MSNNNTDRTGEVLQCFVQLSPPHTLVLPKGRPWQGQDCFVSPVNGQEVIATLLKTFTPADLIAAASHDSQSLVPHLSRLLARHPDLKGLVTRVLDDGTAVIGAGRAVVA